jgi:hypothetical protein
VVIVSHLVRINIPGRRIVFETELDHFDDDYSDFIVRGHLYQLIIHTQLERVIGLYS